MVQSIALAATLQSDRPVVDPEVILGLKHRQSSLKESVVLSVLDIHANHLG